MNVVGGDGGWKFFSVALRIIGILGRDGAGVGVLGDISSSSSGMNKSCGFIPPEGSKRIKGGGVLGVVSG